MLQDVQDNAQYIAYAVAYLSQHKPIPVIGWSQGNLAFSWSVTFFKSIRAGVKQHISFAGDFAGVGTFSSAPKGKKRSLNPFGAPSVQQQVAPSQCESFQYLISIENSFFWKVLILKSLL